MVNFISLTFPLDFYLGNHVGKREKKVWVGKIHFNLRKLPEYTGVLRSSIKTQKLTSFVEMSFKK